jgi:regulator of protease activity HflC (stomatin/prohibitin superfamily)
LTISSHGDYRHFDEYSDPEEPVMADITRLPFLRHLRGAPTTYVRHVTRGRVRHQGVGLSFWFRPLPAVLSEVPLDDRELPLLFHGRTADFQDVTVQATVTWRVVEPERAAGRLDFGIDPDTGRWRGTPLEQLGGLLTGLAQQHALDLLAGLPLQTAITDGMTLARERLTAGLAADERVTGTGIAVVGVRVVAVRPEPDVERALQTPAREQVQQDADKATFERRALAVERERAIGENELQSQIELAVREERLVAQRGANERRRAEEAAEADRIAAAAQAGRARVIGATEAGAEAARVAVWRELDQATVLALAARDLAGNLPGIGTLNITPDLLTGALARLTGEPR